MPSVTISGLMGGVFKVNLNEIDEMTVAALKKEIAAQASKAIEADTMTLIFAGKPLQNQGQYGEECHLKDFAVKDGSTIQLVMRLPGGQAAKQYDRNKHRHLNLTTEVDSLDPFTNCDPNEYRAMMLPCKHPVDPDSLTSYVKTEIDKGLWRISCRTCHKEWPYSEIREKALLTARETHEFESNLSENYALANDKIKQCPNCQSYVERRDEKNLRVLCVMCGTYEFCWNCLTQWVGNGTPQYKCGRPICESSVIKLLRECDEIVLTDVQNVRVPRYRACPSCGQLIEHQSKACKNIVCTMCGKEFCFLCLQLKSQCLKTSSHYVVCTVKPRQC